MATVLRLKTQSISQRLIQRRDPNLAQTQALSVHVAGMRRSTHLVQQGVECFALCHRVTQGLDEKDHARRGGQRKLHHAWYDSPSTCCKRQDWAQMGGPAAGSNRRAGGGSRRWRRGAMRGAGTRMDSSGGIAMSHGGISGACKQGSKRLGGRLLFAHLSRLALGCQGFQSSSMSQAGTLVVRARTDRPQLSIWARETSRPPACRGQPKASASASHRALYDICSVLAAQYVIFEVLGRPQLGPSSL